MVESKITKKTVNTVKKGRTFHRTTPTNAWVTHFLFWHLITPSSTIIISDHFQSWVECVYCSLKCIWHYEIGNNSRKHHPGFNQETKLVRQSQVVVLVYHRSFWHLQINRTCTAFQFWVALLAVVSKCPLWLVCVCPEIWWGGILGVPLHQCLVSSARINWFRGVDFHRHSKSLFSSYSVSSIEIHAAFRY